MYIFISILIVLASIFLIFMVIVQNSKGGGLAAGFSSSNQVMGVRRTTDFLEKATWASAAVVVLLSVAVAFFLPSATASTDSQIKENIQNTELADPNAVSPFSSPVQQEEPNAENQ